ncbi:MAG: hypothetical protein WBL99_09210, partial [Candidatus Acidiferrales bacterium]
LHRCLNRLYALPYGVSSEKAHALRNIVCHFFSNLLLPLLVLRRVAHSFWMRDVPPLTSWQG